MTGQVTIDATGAAGISVALSGGATATTNSSGQYTFSDVAAGSYTVTISGFASDVAFPTTTQAAVVATAGQVVTVNFSGSKIKTSGISGFVTSGAAGLQGLTVTLSGAGTGTRTTDGRWPVLLHRPRRRQLHGHDQRYSRRGDLRHDLAVGHRGRR